jgi:hypothetical protein
MLVYAEEKKDFLAHVRNNQVSDLVHERMKQKLGHSVSASEQNSWQVSLQHMKNILDDDEIPDNTGVAIEYNVPQTGKRIDFIISGYDENRAENVIIVELKQWDKAHLTKKDAMVHIDRFGDVVHPSYQAWSYKTIMEDFNTTIQEENIHLYPCAYLHNFKEDAQEPTITNHFYQQYLEQAPVFLKKDNERLRDFIKRFVKYGDNKELLYKIEAGKIRPSKNLANSLASMLQGNREFVLIDDQKSVYEIALDLADTASSGKKQVLIVRGGPGTGKTVVAINLLVELTKRSKNIHYVTSNAAPRAVYESKLTGVMRKSRISNLFKGATVYQNLERNCMDVLVVDEAHRLSARNIMNTYIGNQVEDMVNAAKLTVFFLDESQKVLIEDIGNEEEINKIAQELGAKVYTVDLPSQFRCNGSDGYIAWLDHTLEIRATANKTFGGIDYDFKVVDSPQELHDLIREKNESKLSVSGSRVVAGYCWPWASKQDPQVIDICIGDYKVQWNKQTDGSLWAITEGSIDQVGCIHTSQGLEFDYVGVIIGEDLCAENGKIKTKPENRHSVDANKTLRGYKTKIRDNDPKVVEDMKALADEIIKNTYKVLMTRGQKGCFVYCCDKALGEYLKSRSGNYYYDDIDVAQEKLMVAEETIKRIW